MHLLLPSMGHIQTSQAAVVSHKAGGTLLSCASAWSVMGKVILEAF